MRHFLFSTVLATVSFATPALADPSLGLWMTEPDRKGQVAHIDVHRCGASLCGKVLRAFDISGKQVTTPNVGKLVFWDMKPTGSGKYEGRAWVPAHNREYDAGMRLSGNQLRVRGCLGPVCQGQTWKRVN